MNMSARYYDSRGCAGLPHALEFALLQYISIYTHEMPRATSVCTDARRAHDDEAPMRTDRLLTEPMTFARPAVARPMERVHGPPSLGPRSFRPWPHTHMRRAGHRQMHARTGRTRRHTDCARKLGRLGARSRALPDTAHAHQTRSALEVRIGMFTDLLRSHVGWC